MRAIWMGALALLVVASPAAAEEDRDCTKAEARDGDHWTWLSERDHEGSLRRHLPWGVPAELAATTNERMIVLTDYINLYDDDLRVPLWSAERIEWRRLGKVPRIDCFRPYPRAVEVSDNQEDYDEPLYDQGHLTPAADQDSSVRAMVNTFFYTNMAPQLARFNRGIWARLEAITRTWVKQKKTLYVISGSIFDRDDDARRDPDNAAELMVPRHGPARVGVPTAFFKIITYRKPGGGLATLSIVLPHQAVSFSGRRQGEFLQSKVTSVAAIEQATSLDFFPDGQDLGEETDFCAFAGGAPRSLCKR